MFDVLVYLFENFFEADIHPDQSALQRELFAAGFDSEEIDQAFDWLAGLEKLSQIPYPPSLADSRSVRFYSAPETEKIDSESRGLLMFLESSGILDPIQREWVIDRAMALDDSVVSLEQVKWIVLMVLWSHGQTDEYLFMEELLFGDSVVQVH